jgi:hypothetical protein
MYHTLANTETIELTERNAPMKRLASELCHKFNLVVMSHDVESMERTRAGIDKEDAGVRARYEDRALRLLLTKQNGLPFCVIRTEASEDRSGDEAVNYVVSSPMIIKNKGRGSDRMTRESINIKALMKNLQKDYDSNVTLLHPEHRFNKLDLGYLLVRGAESVVKSGYGTTLTFSEAASRSILEQIFENKPLNQTVVDYLKTKYDDYQKSLAKKAQVQEIVDRFMTDCYVVLKHDFAPAVVSKVTLSKKIVGNDVKTDIRVHDGVKCYSDMDSLAEDHPDLALSVKMFGLRNEIDKNNSWAKPFDKKLFPIANYIPNHHDKLDADIDVLAGHSTVSGYYNFSSCNMLLVPVGNNGQ